MTDFEPWLRRLRSAGLLVDSIPPAFNGLKWSEPIVIAGDYTGATLEGTVSLTPGAAALATFDISGPLVAGGNSTWIASLDDGAGANSTGGLWTDTGDGDGDGIVELAAMFRLTPDLEPPGVLFGGTFALLDQA